MRLEMNKTVIYILRAILIEDRAKQNNLQSFNPISELIIF
jgi:hypothetical protein